MNGNGAPGSPPRPTEPGSQQQPPPHAQRPGTKPLGHSRKKGTACTRCRSQKIRCDDQIPSCGNCARLGHPCIRGNPANNPDTASYITQMEARLRSLEDTLRRVAPHELGEAPAVVHDVGAAVSAAYPGDSLASMSQGPLQWPEQQFPGVDGGNVPVDRALPNLGTSRAVASVESDSRSANGVSPASSSHFGVSEPLAHEVGMLSLTNSTEAKYVGPSSGVPFARLIFSSIPQSQGLPANWAASSECGNTRRRAQAEPLPRDWTSDVDLQHFVDAYFETYQPLYPFLDEDAISDRLELLHRRQSPALNSLPTPRLVEVEAVLTPVHSVQMFLIIALGARVLEVRLSADFSSERYLASAMQRINTLSLHDNLDGLQVMLLLALSSFYFENGPNAWFLTSSLIASCLDLGLQRQCPAVNPGLSIQEQAHAMALNELRRGIFWSVYSLERTLSVVLGRPLTLRDEAIDVEFPGEVGPGPSPASPSTISRGAGPRRNEDLSSDHPPKSARMSAAPYIAAQYSFRFDQITAEIKLVLYRVVNLPNRFPWTTDVDRWREETHQRCSILLSDLKEDMRRRSRRGLFDCTTRSLELKYHHCLMLLHRPSPAISRPNIDSWKTCYNSAVATVLINSDLHRFSKLSNSWLTAHTIFVSGITFLYCLWAKPEIKNETPHGTFTSIAATCTTLLEYLGRTWSVAADAMAKFERLVHLTTTSWTAAQESQISEVAAGHSLLSMSQAQMNPEMRQNGGGYEAGGGIPSAPLNPDASVVPDLFAAEGNDGGFKPESFFGEIGDMSTWFDLDWLVGAGT